MTREQLMARRLALQERRRHRADRRALLDEETQASRDAMFRECFLAAVHYPCQGQIRSLTELVDAGATTEAFEDYELCANGNFATALDHWLEPYPHFRRAATGAEHWLELRSPHPQASFELLEEALCCLEIGIEAGDAFLTNRAYVGNGGARSLYWLLDWLLRVGDAPAWQAKALLVERCFYAMCVAAPEESRFWDDLQEEMWRPFLGWRSAQHRFVSGPQYRVARMVFDCLVKPIAPSAPQLQWFTYPLQGYIGDPQPCSTRVFALFLLTVPCLWWLFPEVLTYLERDEELIEEDRMEFVSEAFFAHWMARFLRSVRERRLLMTLLEASPRILHTLLMQPVHVFRLVRQRERRILQALLRLAPGELLAMRDQEGRSLLLYACTCRGRIERVIERLYWAGFSLQATDDKGRDALALARRYGDRKVRSMVESLASREARTQGAIEGEPIDAAEGQQPLPEGRGLAFQELQLK